MKEQIKCYRCGREPSGELKNGEYWCSWCGKEFNPKDATNSGISNKEEKDLKKVNTLKKTSPLKSWESNRKDVANQEHNEILKIKCPKCAEIYFLGEDTLLITDEDSFGALEARGVKGIRPKNPNPDLAMHAEIKLEDRSAILIKVQQIKQDISSGIKRQWYCEKCKSINEYPIQNEQSQTMTPVPYYLAGVLIVIESEPIQGKAALIDKVLNSRCDSSGNCTLRSVMDNRTKITVLFDKRLAHLSNTEVNIFGLEYSQKYWRLPVNLKDEWCQHSIGDMGWFLELWQKLSNP